MRHSQNITHPRFQIGTHLGPDDDGGLIYISDSEDIGMPIANPDSPPDPLLSHQRNSTHQNPLPRRMPMEDGQHARQAKHKLAQLNLPVPSHSMRGRGLQNGHQYGKNNKLSSDEPIRSFTDDLRSPNTNGKRLAKFTPNGTHVPDINETRKIFEPVRLDLRTLPVKKNLRSLKVSSIDICLCDGGTNDIIYSTQQYILDKKDPVASPPAFFPSNKKLPPGKREFMFELIAWTFGSKLLPDDSTSKYFLLYQESCQRLTIRCGKPTRASGHIELFLTDIDIEIEQVEVCPSTVQLIPAFIAFTVFRHLSESGT
jgi:hypothetical protein